MKRAYLDNNVFVDIEESNISIEQIIKNVDPLISSIHYSSAHIQEAEEILGEEGLRDERIMRRLKTIGSITNNCYINSNLNNEVFFQNESPHSVLETIREVEGVDEIMKSFVSLVSSEQKEQFRIALGLDPKKVNNYTPDEVINQFNSKLTEWGTELTFLELIEQSIGYNPQGATFGLSHRMSAMFELLDMLGYWKDKVTSRSDYARFWDSNHTYYACHCEYFISDDKRTRNKAIVLYKLLGIGTKVISTKG